MLRTKQVKTFGQFFANFSAGGARLGDAALPWRAPFVRC
jgi:hypothetical protein